MAISFNNFLDIVNKDPLAWKRYCEILILSNGMIELARPCHQEKLINIYCNKMNINKEEFKEIFPKNLSILDFICEKYSIVSVWYNSLILPKQKLNRFQQNTLNKLIEAGLVSSCAHRMVATEYTWYLNNKERININYEI